MIVSLYINCTEAEISHSTFSFECLIQKIWSCNDLIFFSIRIKTISIQSKWNHAPSMESYAILWRAKKWASARFFMVRCQSLKRIIDCIIFNCIFDLMNLNEYYISHTVTRNESFRSKMKSVQLSNLFG